MTAFDLAGFVADVRRDRLRAIRGLPPELDADIAFALRRLLFTDRDAHVRAAAARTLASWPGAEPWLLERITDRAPLVRDAIVRALARCGTTASSAPLRELVERDSVWWVRRAACYALAALPCDDANLATFTRTLADPFWRVRHAAVRVLSLLGARDPDVRDAVLASPATPTVAFLRGTWGPVAVEAPQRATAPSLLPPALLDPDPAVVTARVPRDPDATPLALVEMLCDPHAPLREVVVRRLAEAGDLDAFEAALDWLEEPRIPHVVDTVRDLLDGLGEPALEVAERALRRTDRLAAAVWAIDWVVRTCAETLYDLAIERARSSSDPALRRTALPIADDDELLRWAAGTSPVAPSELRDRAPSDESSTPEPLPSIGAALIDDIAAELHGRRAFDELLTLDGSAHPRVRALQADAAARRRSWDRVEAAASDPHHGPRAVAARWLVRRGRADASRFLADRDPTVREAALSAIVVEHGAAPLPAAIAALDDRDPNVRRMAARALVIASRALAETTAPSSPPRVDGSAASDHPDDIRIRPNDGQPASAHRTHPDTVRTADSDTQLDAQLDTQLDSLEGSAASTTSLGSTPDVDTIVRVAAKAFGANDPAIPRIACELPLDDDRLLLLVIDRTGDADEAVRCAATEAIDRRSDVDARLRAMLAARSTLAPRTRLLAYSWLLRRLDDQALELARTAYDRETTSEVRTLLLGVATAISTAPAAATTTETAPLTDETLTHATTLTDEPLTHVTTMTDATLAHATTPTGATLDHATTPVGANLDHATTPVGATTSIVSREAGEDRIETPALGTMQTPAARAGVERRPFGRAGFAVAPLAISGAFDLPREGLEHAAAAGVDLYFWEPGYDVLGRFLRNRPELRVLTGTYHADAASIRGDVERALRVLRRDTLDGFLLFWTRSPARVDDAAYRVLDQLKRDGKVRAVGFSTHFRDLARDAIAARPWDVVMIRHSAAHPGIETELLPAAREANTAIVTFSALTYGRMTTGNNAPSPADCYRYSIAQSGVTACISAPRRIEELAHNLGALAEPTMSAERLAEMRTFGIGVRAESARVNTLLRQPTRDAAAAAREMLASEPAPASTELRLPAANAARRSRARLGGKRRR